VANDASGQPVREAPRDRRIDLLACMADRQAVRSGCADVLAVVQAVHLQEEYRTVPFGLPKIATPSLSMMHTWTLGEYLAYIETWAAARRYPLDPRCRSDAAAVCSTRAPLEPGR
jgi:hypothetical protein